ncbi:5-oxoprolinase subunit PxpA [Aliikangiella coralliicola]|uniref:5-oxoprolinase subunit PxpA n=1 Tax=Aliikangiella coralliicola TaxID=2592383 RepID=A0A545UK24_9GAMM|nr:5-oxoprolinase subunit PxpA [Aliikangiella coralliicola]TQV89809.1 5-oxoprolinase subunit PxpA [Aliikangiella coralliicola]
MNSTIDINCDLGEGNSAEDCEKDARLMPFISSCNIACGGHAGNEKTILISLLNASKHQLNIGAHPGYPDKKNFGRVSMSINVTELESTIYQQLNLITEIAEQQSIQLNHVKLHGALYNDVEKSSELATRVATLIKSQFAKLKIFGLAGGKLQQASHEIGVEFVAEGFMDRAYLANGQLAPRSIAGAVLEDEQTSIRQAVALAAQKPIQTIENKTIHPKVDTICLHGDNPRALSIIKNLADALKLAKVTIQ